MKKRIKITESQYNKILLNERPLINIKQSERNKANEKLKKDFKYVTDRTGYSLDPGNKDGSDMNPENNTNFRDEYKKSMKDDLIKPYPYNPGTGTDATYDYTGGIGASLRASGLPATGDKKEDDFQQMLRYWGRGGSTKHDSVCNDRQKINCKNSGGIATNRTEKGKVWDQIENLGYLTDDGTYLTKMYGHWDNDDYTKCWCSKNPNAKVIEKTSTTKGMVPDYENRTFKWGEYDVVTTICQNCFGTYMRAPTTTELIKMRKQENETQRQKMQRQRRELTLYGKKNRDFSSTLSSDNFLYKYRHEILDVLAIAALAIPLAGPFISGAIELTNASMYYKEGDNFMGNLYVGLAFLPGGIQAFKAIKGAGIIKGVDKVTKEVAIMQKGGQNVSKEVLENKLKKELGEKVFNRSEKILNDYYSVVLNAESTASQKAIKEMTDLVSKTPAYYKQYLKSSQLVEKLIAKNGGDPYKAYLAYLRSVAGTESKIAAYIYGGIVGGIKTYEVTTSEIRRANLEKDAKKGNISSIVRLAGYDWNITREIFGSDKSAEDNELLKKAWQSGWRPYEAKYKKDLNNPNLIPIAPDKEFWTQTFKDRLGIKDVEIKDKVEDVVNDESLSDDEKSEKIKELVPINDKSTKIIDGEKYLDIDIGNEDYLISSDSLNTYIKSLGVEDIDISHMFGGGQ